MGQSYSGSGYNANNQPTNNGDVYDSNGNPTSYATPSGTKSLVFDNDNRLSVAQGLEFNVYRADGLRGWINTSAGGSRYFLYDGNMPIAEMDVSGNILATNVYGQTGLLSRRLFGATPSQDASIFFVDPLGFCGSRGIKRDWKGNFGRWLRRMVGTNGRLEPGTSTLANAAKGNAETVKDLISNEDEGGVNDLITQKQSSIGDAGESVSAGADEMLGGAAIDAASVSFGQLASENKLYESVVQTSKGPVTGIAEVEVNGGTLILKDVAIHTEGAPITGQTGPMLRWLSSARAAAKAAGFDTLIIRGERMAGSSSANPGHMVEIVKKL